MRLFSSLLTFSLLHTVLLVSGRWETGNLDGEIPRPTPDPLLYRDGFKHGSILMETRPGRERNGTARSDLTLGPRQLTCNDPGYTYSCPSRPKPCCPPGYPTCCSNASSVCCKAGGLCVGIKTCCNSGEVGCTSPEGCCPRGTTCCGVGCCKQGLQCRSGECVDLALSSSLASVRSAEAERSRASVASVHSRTSNDTSTSNTNTNTNTNTNVGLVGGVVGGVLGAVVLGVGGILWWRRQICVPDPSPDDKPGIRQLNFCPCFLC